MECMEQYLASISQRLKRPSAVERSMRRAFLTFLNKCDLPPSSCALSVSVGDGIWDYLLLTHRQDVTAIIATDIVECPVKAEDVVGLNQLGRWRFVQVGPEAPLPFANGRFDLVFHQDTIEHVSRPYLFLQEQHRVLRQGGYLICGTPNLLRPANLARIPLGKLRFPVKLGRYAEIGDYIHLQEFTAWQLETMLAEAGFREIQQQPCFWGLHPFGLTFSALPQSRVGRTMCHYLMFCARK